MKKTNNHKTILIVEDEKDLLELLSDKFVSSGFQVIRAQSGEEGIDQALVNQPDLILLDIILPRMDGLTMLKQLRQDSWGKGVPVIVLSNLSDQKKISEAMQIGVYDFLIKSNVKLADIVSQVKQVLE